MNLFLNHRDRIVAGGKHNDLVHSVDIIAPATLSNEIFCVSFLVKNHIFNACNNGELNSIPQPQE